MTQHTHLDSPWTLTNLAFKAMFVKIPNDTKALIIFVAGKHDDHQTETNTM